MGRREFLRGCSLSTMGLLVPGTLLGQASSQLNELAIPDLYSGDSTSSAQSYSLQTRQDTSRFLPGLETPTLGINGSYLGPTLKFLRGDHIAMAVENALDEPTSLHWHGLHVPAIADGGPHQLIQPGATWRPEFQIRQQPGTFWYHSHALGKTGEQVYKGLAGLIIIEDDAPMQSSLPSDYGVNDIPLIVQDRRFTDDGNFAYVRNHRDIMIGFHGNTVLVNGTYNPVFSPKHSKIRFRLLNAANARTFVFAFSDGRDFQLVSCDGSYLESPANLNRVVLAPSERADIVVDFSNGEPVSLISEPLASDSAFAPRGMMRNMHPLESESLQILAIEPQSTLQISDAVPSRLATVQRIPESEAIRQRSLTLSMMMGMGGRMRGRQGGGMNMGRGNFFINGEPMDMSVINQRIPVGDTEIWEISNDSMMMHPFHIHHSQFQILSRNGRPPSPQEMGFKDTVKVGPGETVRFIMRFENFADSEHPYMYHCHILEHEDNGMMGQFVVE